MLLLGVLTLNIQQAKLLAAFVLSVLTHNNSRVDFITIAAQTKPFRMSCGSAHARHDPGFFGLNVISSCQIDTRGAICQSGIIVAE